MKKKIDDKKPLALIKVTRTIYFLIIIFIAVIIAFDSGNLLTREAIIDRWTIISVLFIINTVIWYWASQKSSNSARFYTTLLLSVALVILAGFMTYLERGMASTSTILYALPLLTIATIKNRHALIATASICSATYAYASVRYFNEYFNEGYRIQLWGTIFFTVGIIFVTCWLIMIISGLRHDSE